MLEHWLIKDGWENPCGCATACICCLSTALPEIPVLTPCRQLLWHLLHLFAEASGCHKMLCKHLRRELRYLWLQAFAATSTPLTFGVRVSTTCSHWRVASRTI